MLGDPDLWFALLDRLVDLAVASLRSQVDAGAKALQLFDSWAGALAPPVYEKYVLPPAERSSTGSPTWAFPEFTSE